MAGRRDHPLVTLTAGLLSLMLAGGLAFLLIDTYVPPQHLPWEPLKLSDPVGLATHLKLIAVKPGQCQAILREGGVAFAAIPDRAERPQCAVRDAGRLAAGFPRLSPAGPVLTCREALGLAIWERQVVQPAADRLLNGQVTAIDQFGSYNCRDVRDRPGQISQHATANALDVAGFRIDTGRHVTVLKDYRDPGPAGQFLHRIEKGACAIFGSTLGPDYNALHRDHFHLDMAPWSMCR
ncbi:MAG: extensin family protein [Caulobacteraceae bacterium]